MNATETRPTSNMPPTAKDLATLKTEFATHAECIGIAELRSGLLAQHRAGDLDQGTVLNIIDWLQNGCAIPAAVPAPVPFRKGQIVTNAARQIVRLYESKAGHLYGKIRDDYDQWVYSAGAMRGVRHLTAEEAAAYGHATEHCIFCGHALEDDRSTSVGYGPKCADRYALPWGAK